MAAKKKQGTKKVQLFESTEVLDDSEPDSGDEPEVVSKLELTEEDKEWSNSTIFELLKKYHQTADQLGLKPKKDPEVKVYLYCGCPTVRYGREVLGRVPLEDIKARNVEAIEEAIFNLPGALTLPIVFSDLETEVRAVVKNRLWGISRALTKGLQAVFTRQFKDPVEGNLESAAYGICNEAMNGYLEGVKDPATKLIKPSSNIVATATKDYAGRFKNWQARDSEGKAPPWPKVTGFPIKRDCFNLEVISPEAYRKLCPSAPKELPKEIVILTLRAQAGAQKRQRCEPLVVRVQVRGGSDWSTLKRCLEGTKGFKVTQGRVTLDESNWVFKMGFKKPRPEPTTDKAALVVIPALNDLALVYGHDAKFLRGKHKKGELPKGIDSSGFLHLKQRYDSMRSSRSRHLNFIGKGAKGHGKKRLRLSLSVLEGKEADRINTWMEQQASHIARYAKAVGAIVGIDDMVAVPKIPDRRIERAMRRFPWCTFRDKIAWACRKHGVPTKIVKHFGGKDCPMCGGEKTLRDFRGGKNDAQCVSCGCIAPKNTLRAWRLFRVLLATDADTLATVEDYFTKYVTEHSKILTRGNEDPENLGLLNIEDEAAE
jgi:hypothetical protein